MKYKLINRKTGEETLCDKVTINGFDYYESNEKITEKFEGYLIDDEGFVRHGMSCEKSIESFNGKKVIATNNPNLDIPKVVDEVEMLGEDETNIRILQHKTPSQIARQYFDGFIQGYNKSQETHPFSDEDMIEFGQWVSRNDWVYLPSRERWVNEDREGLEQKLSSQVLLQIWKEERIKTLYYE